MKGGITSGVVYPYAITELATKHRFKNIGGASAGAIAAGIAAAAEYNRAGGGFIELSRIPDDVSGRLLSLFQPAPSYRGIFRTFLGTLGNRSKIAKVLGAVLSALKAHWFVALVGAMPALLLVLDLVYTGLSWPVGIVAVIALIVGPLLAVAVRVFLILFKGLPSTLFGVCPGLQQPGYDEPGLTEWLSTKIEEVAGRTGEDRALPKMPLTFGELEARGVNLEVIATNLSLRRPYSFPQSMSEYCFREQDFELLFPGWIMTYLKECCETVDAPGPGNLRKFPDAKALPVIVAVRMSLSFPILLCAVPLYRRDFTYRLSKDAQDLMRPAWFSDGGISSNFPIHFFDSLWPTQPTFALSLEDYHEHRHGDRNVPTNRVYMHKKAGGGTLMPMKSIGDLPTFVMSIVSAAKDWQDNMQSVLSGYRERIAHIALTTEEGGLNLTMPESRVRLLTELGYLAGKDMLDFDFDEHRWRRFLVALARVEDTLHELRERYDAGFDDFLRSYPQQAQSYNQSPAWMDEALDATHYLMKVVKKTMDNPLRTRGKIPRPETDMRITPKLRNVGGEPSG